MPISLLTTRSAGSTIVASTDNSEFQAIIDELNTHTAAVSPHSGHVLDTGDTMTGTLTLDQDSATATCLTLDGEQTTANGITANLDALTTGVGFLLSSNSTSTSTRDLMRIVNDNTAATSAVCLDIDQDADAPTVTINSDGTTDHVMIFETVTQTTGNIIDIASADSLTTGGILRLSSNSSSASIRNLVTIVNNNASATSATCLNLDQNANVQTISIDSEATTAHIMDFLAPTTTTGNVIDITDADALTTGSIVSIASNSSDVSSRSLLLVANGHSSAASAICGTFNQSSVSAAISLTCSRDPYTGNSLDISCTMAADTGYNFIRARSGAGADTEFRVRGDGQIFADQGTISSPADYVCHDCGYSTLEEYKECPKCGSSSFYWNDDVKHFFDLAMNKKPALQLAEKMGLIERKGDLSDGYNMNINRMIGFMGFAMNQMMRRIEILEERVIAA